MFLLYIAMGQGRDYFLLLLTISAQSMKNGFLKGLTASLETQAKQSMMEVCRKADDAKKKMDSFLELIGKRWRE